MIRYPSQFPSVAVSVFDSQLVSRFDRRYGVGVDGRFSVRMTEEAVVFNVTTGDGIDEGNGLVFHDEDRLEWTGD